MEFIQALVMLILAIGFNGGISGGLNGGLNGEILPPGATLIPPGQYKSAEEVFSGEDQYKAYSEDEDGTLIMTLCIETLGAHQMPQSIKWTQ